MKAIQYARQGDVHILKLDEFPKGKRVVDEQCRKRHLAYGELSGHVHEIQITAELLGVLGKIQKEIQALEVFKILDGTYDRYFFLDVKNPVMLRHGKIEGFHGKEADQDYHHSGVIEPGKYVVGIVQETDHVNQVIRRVVD